MLAERVCSVRDEEVLLRNVPLMGLELSSSEAKRSKEEQGVPLLQTLKIRIGKAKVFSAGAEEQEQEQDISTQYMKSAMKKASSPRFQLA